MARKAKPTKSKTKPKRTDPKRAQFMAALRDVATSVAATVDLPTDPKELERCLDDIWNSDVSAMADEIGDPLGLLSDIAVIEQFATWVQEDRDSRTTKKLDTRDLDAGLQKVFATPAFQKAVGMIEDERGAIDTWEDYLLVDLKKVMPAAKFATVRKQLLSDMAVEEHASAAFLQTWRETRTGSPKPTSRRSR